jgi:hypothetical protein
MNSSNKLSHDLSNNVESILMALEAIEIKLSNKDLEGALNTIELIKEKKNVALETIKKIHQVIENEYELKN